jgi:hypothetical protein
MLRFRKASQPNPQFANTGWLAEEAGIYKGLMIKVEEDGAIPLASYSCFNRSVPAYFRHRVSGFAFADTRMSAGNSAFCAVVDTTAIRNNKRVASPRNKLFRRTPYLIPGGAC